MVSCIVAIAKNNVIGSKSDLPWYLPADLAHFKKITSEHTVIMGRRTCDSIVARLGHVLPNRTNIVITRNRNYIISDALVVDSFETALKMTGKDEAFVIGGAQIYEQALPYVDRLYITEIHATIKGDTFFPNLDINEWEEVSREQHVKDERNQYDYTFATLDRK